jgi:hypothetical protein
MGVVGKIADKRVLMTFALAIGAVIAVAERVLFGWLLDRPPDFSGPDALIGTVFIVAIPFLVLALRGSNRVLPWLVALAITLLIRWHALQMGVAYQRAPDGSGVDMGLGLLMLVSPAFVVAVCVAIDRPIRRSASAQN